MNNPLALAARPPRLGERGWVTDAGLAALLLATLALTVRLGAVPIQATDCRRACSATRWPTPACWA
jgi:hypothetical protein